MFSRLRQILCWHRWKLLGRTDWSNGSTQRDYICEKCLHTRTIKHR